jgi:hypothetical protein
MVMGECDREHRREDCGDDDEQARQLPSPGAPR